MKDKKKENEVLTKFIKKCEFTQIEIAEKVGVTAQHLIDLRNGKSPRLDRARKIAKILGVHVDVVFPEVKK